MKPIFRCEYCDKIGVEEEILKHEAECIYNRTRRSCYTCKHAERSGLNISCKWGREIPSKKYFQDCDCYEWDEVDHATENPVATNSIFGGLWGL